MNPEWINALIGGALIGLAVSLMLMLSGRVTGISGIVNGIFIFNKKDLDWRLTFFAGLVFGGFALKMAKPEVFESSFKTSPAILIVAGLLVGFGTIMGSGCTSGHGVCGISRLSIRSLIATMAFIIAGVAMVYLLRLLGVLQ